MRLCVHPCERAACSRRTCLKPHVTWLKVARFYSRHHGRRDSKHRTCTCCSHVSVFFASVFIYVFVCVRERMSERERDSVCVLLPWNFCLSSSTFYLNTCAAAVVSHEVSAKIFRPLSLFTCKRFHGKVSKVTCPKKDPTSPLNTVRLLSDIVFELLNSSLQLTFDFDRE